MLTPRKTTPIARYLWYVASRSRASRRHGDAPRSEEVHHGSFAVEVRQAELAASKPRRLEAWHERISPRSLSGRRAQDTREWHGARTRRRWVVGSNTDQCY